MAGKRRRWTADEKLRILREGREAGESVAEVCRRHGITPGQFYAWEKRAREGALKALRRVPGRRRPDRESHLEGELSELRAVVTELLTENLRLKKGRWP
ncbi:MAG: transposase [Candidatus Binatia bacterium]